MSKDEQREILALVSWLQTFDQFPYSVVDGGLDGDNSNEGERFNIALESLENTKISRAVVSIAEQVCDMQHIDIGANPTAKEIWRTLLHITASKSRFEINIPNNSCSNHEVPHIVMANMLDFAVTSPDLEERRKYIESIMSLSKSIQKILMNLIERRKKSLPRKPKPATPAKNMRALASPRTMSSPRGNNLCGESHGGDDDTDHGGEDSEVAAMADMGKAVLRNCSGTSQDPHYHDDSSENTPLEPPQRMQGFSTPPKRERNPKIPQSEPRNTGRDNRSHMSTPTDSERSHVRRFSGSTDASQDPEEEIRAPKPRQPEGYYLSPGDRSKNRATRKGFASPPKDQRGKQKGTVSANKRHSTGSSSTMPFRERQNHSRAAFVSISNQSKMQHPSKTSNLAAPPPPPPPYPPKMMNGDQKMPSSSTPSEELELTNPALTEATLSTVTESSMGTSDDIALNLRSYDDGGSKPSGKVITLDKNRRQSGGAFSTPPRPQQSTASESPRPKTPECALAMYERDVEGRMMLSPAESMLQSPMQVDEFVKELRAKNKNLESILQSYQKRERELSQKMESTENKLRKEMMKLESRALGREDELRRSYDEEIARLKKELNEEQEKNRESKKAKEQLANANDELDLMQHTHEKLLEATEKIRKYKERLDNMNDFKEALEREQEAHNKSVDECVRLQNELNALQPVKRQLEDYKNRALEMEVQLAETKDALARLEREREELDGARDDVMKEANAHRAQADELRKFIRLEEQEGKATGIGEGISELNPELQEELIKLRNENEQLRSFKEARSDDSVQRLQYDLEDSNQRQERFKEEYLKTKNKLEGTDSLLTEAKQKLEELEADIEQKDYQANEYENRLSVLEDHYTACLEDLEGLQDQIDETEQQKNELEKELAEWKEMADKLDGELKARSGDLDETKKQLSETEEIKSQVETDLAGWKQMADKLESELAQRASELDETKKTLGVTEEEKTKMENGLAEWKQMSEKLQEDLLHRNEELEANKKSLETVHEEKSQLESQLAEVKETTEKLETELNTRSSELDETKEQLNDKADMLAEAEKRQEELLSRVDVYEKKLIQAEDDNEAVTKELEETLNSLKEAQGALKEAEERESNLNDECTELKDVSEQLVQQLREEKKAKKAIMEESHKSLEATREVLNSKAKKDLEELQANMNQLLNDERKAYRLKAEKATADYKSLEEKYKNKLKETQNESTASLKKAKDDCYKRLKEMEDKMKKEMETVKKQEEEKRKNLIATGEKMIEEAKEQATQEITEMHQSNLELKRLLKESEGESKDMGKKNASLKKKLEYATSQINELENTKDEIAETKQHLEREKQKLEEENDRFRRQLGGRYGADGQLQNHLEKLKQELHDAHEENKKLKKDLANRNKDYLSSSFSYEEPSHGYTRGEVSSKVLSEVRQGYEQEIEQLKAAKRELVMQHSSAITEVQKAEQVASDRANEIEKMKRQILSLNLKLERAELCENNENSYYSQANETSFYSAARDTSFTDDVRENSFVARENGSPDQRPSGYASWNNTARDTSFSGTSRDMSFPKQDESNESYHESHRQRQLSVNAGMDSNSWSFSQPENQMVLTPSKKHGENANNSFSERPNQNTTPPRGSASKPNPYELHLQEVNRKKIENRSVDAGAEKPDSIVNYTQAATGSPREAADSAAECAQS